MARFETQLLPSFSAYLQEIRENGISESLLNKIIDEHTLNSQYNRDLYKRYMAINGGVPIFDRQPRYEEEDPINNKVNNDFFSEIVDFETGYFAGEPISYSYSTTQEAKDETGGDEAVQRASKALTDFTTRNNMFGVDMETTKLACIYGYAGRLFYIDTDGQERVMPIHGYETIILSDTDISEPEFAIRYYKNKNINGVEYWTAEFYDDRAIKTFEGNRGALTFKSERPHNFDYCPLQGIAHNKECLGSAEKVLALIDDYDKVLSDNSNEIESFVHALLLVNLQVKDDTELLKAQKSGMLVIPPVGANSVAEPVKWVTKNINDGFTQNHLSHLEQNIYRFSRTPNMSDTAFATASGISLKFKLHGLETKCSTFEASLMNAAQHMWKVLSSSWAKKGIKVDPLQIVMEFNRNFPLDKLSEAQTAQQFLAAGLPKRWVYGQIAGIDDVQYILDLIDEEKNDITSLYDDVEVAEDKASNEELNTVKDGEDKANMLNGAQIQALTGIIKEYTEGNISRNSAITIATSSLGISRANAEAIIEEKIKS